MTNLDLQIIEEFLNYRLLFNFKDEYDKNTWDNATKCIRTSIHYLQQFTKS